MCINFTKFTYLLTSTVINREFHMNITEKPVSHLIGRFKVGVGARGSAVDPAG